jgi:aryl-alcohol dehydrogenase-like predicted oxidoreductase
METRTLGRSGTEISPMGMGTWAMGGPTTHGGLQSGWGEVDDDKSMAALERGMDLGITFIDTADVYGTGHSERLVGHVIADRRDEVIVATKFGFEYDEMKREIWGGRGDRDYVMEACDRSLERLGIDTIDLYQFHLGGYDGDAEETRDALEQLVDEGKIRWYGWSTDVPENARVFAEGDHCCAVQQSLSVLGGNWQTLRVCHEENLASINRGPLVKGLLTGKFDRESTFGDRDNRRRWDLKDGSQAEQLEMFEQIREVLTSGGRTAAQGALCWIWGLSDRTVPIPGVKTPEQAEENARAMEHGPLSEEEMARIDEILGRDSAYRGFAE